MDCVWRNILDGEGTTHLQEVLEMGVGVLMRLPTERVCLHHVDECWLKLKSRISQVKLRTHGDVVSQSCRVLRDGLLGHSLLAN